MNNIKIIIELYKALPKKRKRQFFFLIIIMILSGLAEIFSISSVIPFLTTVTNPNKSSNFPFINDALKSLGINNIDNLVLIFTLIFIFISLISACLKILNIWLNNKYAALIGNDLSTKSYRNALYESYEKHIGRNSSEIISTLTIEITRTTTAINFLLRVITSFFLIFSISIGLLLINPILVLGIYSIFSLGYFLFYYLNKEQLSKKGKLISLSNNKQVKILQEGLGGIKNVLIDNSQEFYIKNYKRWDFNLRNAIAEAKFISQFPRYFMEGLGITSLAFVGLFISSNKNISFSDLIPILAVAAISIQKLLPALQAIYSSLATIKENTSSIKRVLKLTTIKIAPEYLYDQKTKPLKFENKVEISNINYFYPDSNIKTIKNLNLIIKKGERIGIKGTTGSGKSTLVDLLAGLIKPSSGIIKVDGIDINDQLDKKSLKRWQKNIANVPQNIFLADASILSNIAFGEDMDKIDLQQVYEAAKTAEIHNFISNLPKKYETLAGERGVKLSGGQVQRIGIARALYKKANFLILDEATSALDLSTEKVIMKSIENLPKSLTLLIIAHRTSTLKNCDRVFNMDNGKLNIENI